MCRIFFDTEFTDLSADAELISAGFVSEFGNEFYVEITDFNKSACSEFVVKTVLPLLDGSCRLSSLMFAQHLAEWLLEQDHEIVLISDSNYDSALLGKVFLPFGGIRSFISDLRYQQVYFNDQTQLNQFYHAYESFFKKHPTMAHHALFDARALKEATLRAEGFY